MIAKDYRTRFVLFIMLSALACIPTLPAFSPPPSRSTIVSEDDINTVVAQTAGAFFSETAKAFSPAPTFTVTPISTNTFIQAPPTSTLFVFILPTFTRTPTATKKPSPVPTKKPGSAGPGTSDPSHFSCSLVKKKPADNTVFSPGTTFQTTWKVRNTGQVDWLSDRTDFFYLSGDALHLKAGYDLILTVRINDTTEVVVDMKAPDTAGTYSTKWIIENGKIRFCEMTLTIKVQ